MNKSFIILLPISVAVSLGILRPFYFGVDQLSFPALIVAYTIGRDTTQPMEILPRYAVGPQWCLIEKVGPMVR